MHREIDKLQKEVDHLLEMCAEGGADELVQDDAPTAQDKKHERLGVMVLKMQDGQLDQRYFLRFEKWLLADPDALHYYIDFQNLSALLHIHYNKSRFSKMIDSIKGCFAHA